MQHRLVALLSATDRDESVAALSFDVKINGKQQRKNQQKPQTQSVRRQGPWVTCFQAEKQHMCNPDAILRGHLDRKHELSPWECRSSVCGTCYFVAEQYYE